MKSVFQKCLIALLAILWCVSSLQAQSVNMSRYITLTVEKGADILLDIAADAANTPIKIVSGDKEQTITVGTSWTGVKSYAAGDATMTVYGDALKLDCSKNGAKVTGLNTSSNAQLQLLFCYKDSISSLDLSNNEELKSLHCFGDKLTSLDVSKNKQLQWLKCHDNRLTAIDVSHNTQLKYMTCYGNDFTTAALDNIYCLLPDRAGQKAGEIQPLLNASSSEKNKVLATNGNNAIARNWKVQYSQNSSVITGFTGTKQCGGSSGVNMDRYITLTVVSGEEINLNFFADADNTPIKIVSGTKEQTITVGASWTGMNKYITDGSTMTVYGNVQKFSCGGNGKNITGLDVSHNSQLTILYCDKNSIISLNVSGNTELKNLDCKENAIASLDLSNCKQLKWVYCNKNALTSLNVSKCEQLELLKCYENKLTSLDVGNNAMLKMLYCEENALTSLDVSRNTELISLYCQQNSISSLNLGGNTKLRILFCYENAIASLDVSKCTQLEWLYCADNPISTLDISHNKHLSTLYCYGNSFTTTTLDDIYCSLPDRKGKSKGDIAPLLNASSADKSKVLATNGNNAAVKGWKAIYYEGNSEITGFTGTKQCGGGSGVNMDRYITLTVDKGKEISLSVYASADNTPIKIVSGDKEYTFNTVAGWTKMSKYTAGAGTMTIYGNVWQFNCRDNAANITGLDASHNAELQTLICNNNAIASLNVSGNTDLIGLYCLGNALTTLDVSKNMKLANLYCYENSLTTLDIGNNTELAFLDCRSNKLTSLDVSKNKKLKNLDCRANKLTAIDVSNNTELESFHCSENALSTLDLSHNSELNSLYCHGNNFTTAALDDIYCSLPSRGGQAIIGLIQPLLNASSPDKDKVLATNGNNAATKNWALTYYENDAEITGFTGTHQCGGGTGIDEAGDLPALAIYPNPVKDVLNIATDKPVHSIRIYNVYGTEVAHATDATSIDVSHLPAGVYMVRADGKATRIIKE